MSGQEPTDPMAPAAAAGVPTLAVAPASDPTPAATPAPPATEPTASLPRFWREAAVLLLLLATVAAILFQDMFVAKTLSLTPASAHSRFEPYAYDDRVSGGTSTVHADPARPLSWSCDLRPDFAFPYCGYGLFLARGAAGRGHDLAQYQQATIRLRYSGPATKLRLVLINRDARYAAAGGKPNQAEVPLRQGMQDVTIGFDDLDVASWWAQQKHVPTALALPQRDNVTAIEIQPGGGGSGGSVRGRHDFQVESITLHGRQMSQAQFYLILLVGWTLLIGLLLAWRVVAIRRYFERRHARELRYRDEMQAARDAAETASAAKSAFLANMSHELGTPLMTIIAHAESLEAVALGEGGAASARTIRRSGTHLLALITDIIDLSKMEAGRLELHPAPFDLHVLVEGVCDMIGIQARQRGLDFACTVNPGVPKRMVGDDRRLRQVLVNLLGNAIKFTSEGEVSLRVTPLPSEGGPARIRIEVRDSGIGMDEASLARIFAPFEQAPGRERASGGTGLGLSISALLVALMGGEIHAESKEGQGSRFWFDIALPPEAGAAMGEGGSAA